MMIWFVIAAVLAIGALSAVVVLMERQMRAMGALLAARQHCDGSRLVLELPTRGARRLALEVNRLIDEVDAVGIAAGEERRELQRNLASFSHDVRTPLAGAQGYLQLYGLAESSAERDECVEEATRRLGAMRVLVDQLFEYAKDGGQRELVFEMLDVTEVLQDCLAELYPAFAGKGWEPQVDAPASLWVLADGAALRRILENVLVNCLNYGSAAPRITLAAKDGAFRLVVANAADGLELLDTDRLCERFYRGDAARRAVGSGLGLAIANNLASEQGMDFSATVEGDCFAVTLAGNAIC